MPLPTPFHERTRALCHSYLWKDWAGYHSVCSFDTCHEREYLALRHACGLIDVTPLFKYEVTGPEAGEFLARVMVRDIRKLKPGRVTYCCWCDDEGKILDDGTVQCLAEGHYRIASAEPSGRWFMHQSRGYDVQIVDITPQVGTLSLQGPTSRGVLADCTDLNMDKFRWFRVKPAKLDGIDVHVSRTGYTGDLGYEIWCKAEDGLKVWDAVMAAGKAYGIEAAGLDAMDVTRVEAGFILAGVDYFAADTCMIESRKLSPWQLDLGWTVQLERAPFIGQAALRREKAEGSSSLLVGLEIDWDELETLYNAEDLPPALPSGGWRTPIPVYDSAGLQVGRATSGAWSPTLKKNLALAHVPPSLSTIGTTLKIEQTVEYVRHQVTARVVKKPFFDPPRKRK